MNVATRWLGPVFLLLAVTPVAAQSLPDARSTDANATVLHLTETAQRNVPRDRLRVELAAEVTDADPAQVQAEINRRMSAALARIKATEGVTLETDGYDVFEEHPDKEPPRWRGSQSIALTASYFAGLLALVGALQQDGLVVHALTPQLSREARQGVEDSLTTAALTRLQERAQRVAAALGTRVERFRDVTVGNAGVPPPVPLRQMSMAAAIPAPPPVAEPGEAVVSISVAADIVLAPRP